MYSRKYALGRPETHAIHLQISKGEFHQIYRVVTSRVFKTIDLVHPFSIDLVNPSIHWHYIYTLVQINLSVYYRSSGHSNMCQCIYRSTATLYHRCNDYSILCTVHLQSQKKVKMHYRPTASKQPRSNAHGMLCSVHLQCICSP